MAKADLERAQQEYDRIVAAAQIAAKQRRYPEAIDYAMSAWRFVDDMMKFERKYEEKEFKSVPCIDLVLKLAPLTFRTDALDRLAELLKSQKAIDRNASDDLAARLETARASLRIAWAVWDAIERTPGQTSRQLADAVNLTTSEVRAIVEQWIGMGSIERKEAGREIEFRLATEMGREAAARCPSCGYQARRPVREFLAARPCEGCTEVHDFVISGS